MKEPNKIIEHYSKSGERFTQELYYSGAAAWEIIKDQFGKEVCTNGSGGFRPWNI